MGDIILITPVLAALKERYPRAQLDVVVKERYAQLLQGHPHVDGLFVLSPGDGLLSLGRRLRCHRHHLVVDLHANLRSRMLSAILPASKKLRYRKRTFRRWAMVRQGHRPRKKPHVVDMYLACLRPLGIEAARSRPRLYLSDQDRDFGLKFFQRPWLQNSGSLVGLHPGARWPGKRWPAEHFIQLGQRLMEERKAQILVFGGPGEEDLAAQVAEGIGPNVSLASGLSLGQLMALISSCALFVTNDSGPMHMATALDVPVVAIFGPTHPLLGFWPLGDEDVVLSAHLPCSPCSLHGERNCHRGQSWQCLERVGVQVVLEAALGILDGEKKVSAAKRNSSFKQR
jgi:heptosyltransferase-2